MRSLLKFIQRYSNFLVFINLEVVAFLFLLSYNEYPKSSVLSTANQVVAWNYKMGNNISSYFHLKATNEALEAENTALRNQIIALQNQLEDSIELSGYTYSHLDYTYIPAKVIQSNQMGQVKGYSCICGHLVFKISSKMQDNGENL